MEEKINADVQMTSSRSRRFFLSFWKMSHISDTSMPHNNQNRRSKQKVHENKSHITHDFEFTFPG